MGESKTEIVKNSVGQGSFGAALASSLIIGCRVQDAFKGKKSTSIGHLDLNSLIMQDDISKLSTSLEEARQGYEDIYKLLTKKQLSVNNTKCKYMILGSKKKRKQETVGESESDGQSGTQSPPRSWPCQRSAGVGQTPRIFVLYSIRQGINRTTTPSAFNMIRRHPHKTVIQTSSHRNTHRSLMPVRSRDRITTNLT